MPFAELDLTTDPPTIRVSTRWNEKDLIQQVPGAHWDTKILGGGWRLPLTWAAAVTLRGVFRDSLTLGQALIDALWVIRRDRVDPAMKLRDLLEVSDGIDLSKLPTDPGLLEFQRIAIAFMQTAGSGLLGDEMGCGKTVEMLGLLQHYHDNNYPSLPALIISPNSVKPHWGKLAERWLPSAEVFVIDGSVAVRRKQINEAKKLRNSLVIINIEALRTFSRIAGFGNVRLLRCTECDKYGDPSITPAKCDVHPGALNGFGFRTIVIDEAHRIKNPKSKQTRATWALMFEEAVQHRWAMTGTPIERDINDLWSVMHGVAPDEFPTKTRFLDRYAHMGWNAFGGMEIVGIRPDTAEELQLILQPRFRRMLKSVVLKQLPPKLHETRVVDLTPAQRRVYNQFEKSLVAVTDDGEMVAAATQLATVTRLSQLSVASLQVLSKPDENDPSTWQVALKEPSSVLDELEVVLDELGDQQCVIAAEHKQLIDLASVRLTKSGISHMCVTGEVAPIDRERALEALRNGNIRCVLFTTKAGGVGLDMSVAPTLIWIQHPWSMIEYRQAEDRVHRIGSEQHKNVTIIHIVARGTIAESKLSTLIKKLEKLDQLTLDRLQLMRRGQLTTELDNEIVAASAGTLGDLNV